MDADMICTYISTACHSIIPSSYAPTSRKMALSDSSFKGPRLSRLSYLVVQRSVYDRISIKHKNCQWHYIINLPFRILAFLVLAYRREVLSLRYMEFIRRLERSTGSFVAVTSPSGRIWRFHLAFRGPNIKRHACTLIEEVHQSSVEWIDLLSQWR